MKHSRAAALLVPLLGAACTQTPAAARQGEPPPSASAPAPGAPASAAAPRLSLEPAAFDFGRVRPRQRLHKEFTLRNLGRAPLIIESVTTSCGCMLAEGYERVLPAGGATTLSVVLNTAATAGPTQQQVLVRSNDPRHPMVELALRATVVASDR